MGAWGIGIFDNDGACDLAGLVAEGGGLAALEEALDAVLAAGPEYLEITEGEAGLAAADIVARLKGNPGRSDSYTEEVDAWVARQRAAPSAALIAKARKAIKRILSEPSELLELWQEHDDFDVWKSGTADVLARL